MINNSTAIGFVNSQGGNIAAAAAAAAVENGNIISSGSNINICNSGSGSNNSASSSQLSSVIENLSNNSDIAALSSACTSLSPSTSSSLLSLPSSSSLLASLSHATHKSYPPINSAYWLPSSHPSPYTVPGMQQSLNQLLSILLPLHSSLKPWPAQMSIFIQLLCCLLSFSSYTPVPSYGWSVDVECYLPCFSALSSISFSPFQIALAPTYMHITIPPSTTLVSYSLSLNLILVHLLSFKIG